MTSREVLKEAVRSKVGEKYNPAGETYRFLTVEDSAVLAELLGLQTREIELAALEDGAIPDRYQRSIGTLGIKGQIRLLQSTVCVVGAGGLGGFVLELLARMGIGRLVVVDDDTFCDSNLNRQLLSLETNLGQPKVEIAAARITEINKATTVVAYHQRATLESLPGIIQDCNLVIDCLDNLPSRFDLEKSCCREKIPMIHGAIAGFLGQIAVIRPEQPLLQAIYGDIDKSGAQKGIEVKLGNPAATPAMLAAWQASEAVKLLAGLPGVLESDKLLIIDMQSGDSYRVDLSS